MSNRYQSLPLKIGGRLGISQTDKTVKFSAHGEAAKWAMANIDLPYVMLTNGNSVDYPSWQFDKVKT